jgi:hypothetical protein
VASFNLFEYRDEAPLFRRLSDRFEECVFGLNLVKQELEEVQGVAYRQLRGERARFVARAGRRLAALLRQASAASLRSVQPLALRHLSVISMSRPDE